MGFVRCLDDTNTEKGIVVKEMIKKVREDRSGFTLAELLIVVAIVAVLVAIAVPVFTGAMGSANEAVGQSAVRSVKAEAISAYLLDKSITDKTQAQAFYATVNKDGSVTNLTKGTSSADNSFGETDDAASIGAEIAKGSAIINVSVTGQNVAPDPTPAG